MKLLTFFGTANYQETTYQWNDETFRTPYPPAASSFFLKPDEVVVFLTKEAEESEHFAKLKAAVPSGINVTSISVPLGENEEELWEIYQIIASQVEMGEEVALDITLGLRSFLLIGLLVAAFLRSGLNVSLKAVLYGAFDVGRATGTGITPFFDLTPMIELLEWSEAADRFNRTGDSRYLAAILKNKKDLLAKSFQYDPDKMDTINPIKWLAGTMTSISQSIQLIRPQETIRSARLLQENLTKARPVFEQYPTTAPFSLLLDGVGAVYAPLAVENASAEVLSFKESLEKQRALIHWYQEREHWVQAITMCREWLVSWAMYQLGLKDMVISDDRSRIEKVLNIESHSFQDAKKAKKKYRVLFLTKVPVIESVLDLWNKTAEVRNDIDHAGMRPDPKPSHSLVKQIKQIINDIDSLPLD